MFLIPRNIYFIHTQSSYHEKHKFFYEYLATSYIAYSMQLIKMCFKKLNDVTNTCILVYDKMSTS